MIERALDDWGVDYDWLLVENVGNLVCPASYDLGEQVRAVLVSVSEGFDAWTGWLERQPINRPAAPTVVV